MLEGSHDPDAPEKPSSVPPDVKSWWHATGKTLNLFANRPPRTVTMPPSVFSFWEDTGWAAFATKVDPHLVLTTPIPPPPNSAKPGPSGPSGSAPSVTDTTLFSPPIKPTSGPSPPSVTQASPPPGLSPATSQVGASSSSSPSDTSISIGLSTVPSDAASSTPTPSSTPSPINAASNKKTARIIAGVVVPLVLIFIGVAAFIIYKRRRRARDRREWERTHDAIADAVRRVGGTPAPGPPAWRPPYNDVKAPLEGDTAPLFEKSGDPSLPGPLEHTGGEFHSGPPSSLV